MLSHVTNSAYTKISFADFKLLHSIYLLANLHNISM